MPANPVRKANVTQWWTLGIKAVNGGLFVVLFSLLAEMTAPKRFAGLFSAAPSVALANLMVVILFKGPGEGAANARGMLIGSAAFALSCLVGIAAVRRYRARAGSTVILLVWTTLAVPAYALVLR
jgi:hypothetical protein